MEVCVGGGRGGVGGVLGTAPGVAGLLPVHLPAVAGAERVPGAWRQGRGRQRHRGRARRRHLAHLTRYHRDTTESERERERETRERETENITESIMDRHGRGWRKGGKERESEL